MHINTKNEKVRGGGREGERERGREKERGEREREKREGGIERGDIYDT